VRLALYLANGSASTNLGLKDLRVQEKGGGGEPTPEVGQSGWLGPTGLGPSRLGSVAPSLPWVVVYLCTLPSPFALFDDVILASKMEVLLARNPVFYASSLEDVPL
jgi:hypothetical protein